MANCTYHTGRPAAGTKFGKDYCQQCLDGIAAAVLMVDAHVVPKECFVVYNGGDTWAPITGTGCAHWVAHQLSISKGSNFCLDGKTLRVPELIADTQTIARADVKVNDIWANEGLTHCGLVIAASDQGITIRHDSSAQGGVHDNDFDSYFHGQGTFHR
jgi:hypothetical protein